MNLPRELGGEFKVSPSLLVAVRAVQRVVEVNFDR
jgi:hypothetical protein